MNLDDLLKEMKEKMQKKDLSDEYLEKNGNTTRTEIGIGEYSYGITTIPCEWVYDFLSDYKRVLKENEELKNKLSLKQFDINVVYNDYLEKLNEYKENSIPKQKVKEKIEELNREIGKSIDNSKGGLDEEFIEKAGELLAQKRILQELLESEE